MPNVDESKATHRKRNLGVILRNLPTVALTANTRSEDIGACLVAETQAYVAKPLPTRDLLAVIAPVVGDGANEAPDALKSHAVDQNVERLRTVYNDRRHRVFFALAALAKTEGQFHASDVSEISIMLHNLAGTAAYFGDAKLGKVAAALENDLRDAAPHELGKLLVDGLEEFRLAA